MNFRKVTDLVTPVKLEPVHATLMTRNYRGLKLLTARVRDIIMQKPATTYAEVADYLIEEFFPPGSNISIKEQKNIRRRVYDALNVLKSAQVIRKKGKTIKWNENHSK
jgi:hypothetical protein